MNTFKTLGFIMLAALSFIACQNKDKRALIAAANQTEPDSTMYVRLESHTEDSLTFTQLDSKRTRTMGYARAMREKMVFGDVTDGDTLAVVPQFKERCVLSVTNLSQLIGLWMFNDNSGGGMRLTADGAACNVGPASVSLRDWKIRNGHFILRYVQADGSDYALRTDSSRIVSLTTDKLVYTLRDSTISCNRTDEVIGQ